VEATLTLFLYIIFTRSLLLCWRILSEFTLVNFFFFFVFLFLMMMMMMMMMRFDDELLDRRTVTRMTELNTTGCWIIIWV